MPEQLNYQEKVEEAVAALSSRLDSVPQVCIQLGTGLGSLVESLDVEFSIPYEKIPHFPSSTVESHAGNLVFGSISGKQVVILQGRFHFYEGYEAKEVAFPIRVLSLLGVKTVIVTNASGGLNKEYSPGTIMLVADHINLLGENPLRGPNVDAWGPRFPDMSEVYDPFLLDLAQKASLNLNFENVRQGVYVCIPGPSLETPAETQFLQSIGADAVGMSSVPEVIVAKHGGMQILALSVVANCNDPNDMQPILLEEIVQAAQAAEPKLAALIAEILQLL